MSNRIYLLPALLVLSTPVAAATLRTVDTLSGEMVHLSDLFDDAPSPDRVLGPAPAPGNRIVVEATQLAAIARQFGVDWHPASSADRAVLDRPARTLPLTEITDALQASLVSAGSAEDCDIELPGFAPPLVSVDHPSQVVVEQIQFDAPSGRFSAVLAVTAADMPLQRLRVAGRALETIQLPVATHRILPGTMLRVEDIRIARVHLALVQTDVAHVDTDVIGMVLHHLALPGQPFPLADLARQAVVAKGSNVLMALQANGLEVAGAGRALEAGALGDQISVMNPNSHAVLQARVIGPGRVQIAPGSLPTTEAQRGPAPQVALR
jgi:flagella basal body P-ring formation protein FlgA